MKTHSETVSFRADDELLKQIDAECEKNKISRGHWVRGIVLAHFHRCESAITKDDIQQNLRQLDDLACRVNAILPAMARSLFLILKHAGELSEERAKKLARTHVLKGRT